MVIHKAKIILGLALLWGSAAPTALSTPAKCIATIPTGNVTPLFGLPKDQTSASVKEFRMDCDAVTLREFDAFLQSNKDWRRDSIPSLYGDERYLSDFAARIKDKKQLDLPIVYVSWFAADAYCQAQKGRLPTTLEWERVAAANATKESAADDETTIRAVLDWYAKPTSLDLNDHRGALHAKNFFGVRGLHGVIWEWTSDFSGFRMTQDNRQQGDRQDDLFCGAAANSASNRTNYAAFMRYALRSSLEGNYSLPNVGFRCAYDNKK